MKISNSLKVVLAIAGVAIVLVGCGASKYNDIVDADEAVTTAWANVQTQYQRRSDLIPNLVNTVKGYADHESGTLEAVVSARAKATQATVDAGNLTPERLQQFQNAQSELSSAIGRLLMIQESYPDLKANEQFSELQAQLEGTENRINESRTTFNNTVQYYNSIIRRFPGNICAAVFGFEKRSKFEAQQGADKAPEVNF